MSRLDVRALIRICEPWHNYKQTMKYDSEIRVRPDGTIVPVINVGTFQHIINNCSGELLAELNVSDPEWITSLMEIVANAKSILDQEAAHRA